MITAAASGIGREVARAFMEAGARVEICDVDENAVAAFEKDYPEIVCTKADVTVEADVRAFFNTALERLGGLDVLVNNAGVSGPTAPVNEIALADWQRTLAVNLDSTFLCTQQAVPVMQKQGSGLIVNMASTAGLFGYPRRAPYAAAKWAIIGLTKTLAMELGPSGIRVNAICPGSVDGERIERVIQAEADATGKTAAAVRREWEGQVSMRTFVTARDVAEVILFLASKAGARISGQSLAVDGHTEGLGMTE